MPDFTLFIPSEIISDILSHVNQLDCTECMIVCRRWYKLVPQYGMHVWKELEISEESSWRRFNNAMLECLGSHVKKISVTSYHNSSYILRRLENQGCHIQSLEIKGSLEIYSFDVAHARLFSGIGLFQRTLKELYINGSCTPNFPLSLLLCLLPALTHLTFKFKHYPRFMPKYARSISNEVQRHSQSINDNNHGNYGLVFLCVDSEFRFDHHIEQTIKQCTRLKYLLVSINGVSDCPEPSSLDFARIVELCPSLSYVHWGQDNIPTYGETEWLTLSRRKNTDDDDNSSDYEQRAENYLRRVEFHSNKIERHISTLKACLQQPSLLEHFSLFGCCSVDLFQLWSSFAQHNINLLSHPSKLKSLKLDRFYIPEQTEIDLSFQSLFSHFQHIERLAMRFILPHSNLEGGRFFSHKVTEAIGDQLQQLQCLHLDIISCVDQDASMILFDTLFTTLCSQNQKLEILDLSDVFISDDMLLDLCCHPNLHTLDLSGYHLHKHLTRKGWISFARKRKEQEQNNHGRIRSISLSCGYCDDVTDNVLEEFAGIKSLETLGIACNPAITDTGVNKFESIKSSSIKNHKKIQLYSCINVSLDNPHADVYYPY